MKKLLALFLIFSMTANPQKVFVHGNVSNYHLEDIPFFKKDYKSFTDIYIRPTTFANNYYEFSFINPKPQLFKLFLEWVYIEPKDSIQFDFSFIDVSPGKFYDSIDAKGRFPGNYVYYKNLEKWLHDKPLFKKEHLQSEKIFYSTLKDFYFQRIPKKINEFVKKNPISTNFSNFIHSELSIAFLADLLGNLQKNNVKLTKELYSKIKNDINESAITNSSISDSPKYVSFGYLMLEYFLPKNNLHDNSVENYLFLKKYIENKFKGDLKEYWLSLLVRSHYFNKPTTYMGREDSLTYDILHSIKDSTAKKSLTSFVYTHSNHSDSELRSIQLIETNNKVVHLGELIDRDTGFVQVIDFWASWCKPCLFESKNLDEILKSLKNVLVKKISIDDDDSLWRKAIKNQGYSNKEQYLVLNKEENKKLTSLIELNSIPRFLIISKTGKIIFLQSYPPSKKKEFIQQIEYANKIDYSFGDNKTPNKLPGTPSKPPIK